MLFKNFVLSLTLFAVPLTANITLSQIDSKPPSRAKNFLIWQYLKQDINKYQAEKAYKQVTGNIHKINRLYYKYNPKANEKKQSEDRCRAKTKLLKIKDPKCLQLAFTPYKSLQLNSKDRDKLRKKLKQQRDKELLRLQNEKISESNFVKYKVDTIVRHIITSGYRYRRAYLNRDFSKEFMDKLATSSKIDTLIQRLLGANKIEKLQNSLLKIDPKLLSAEANFHLGLIATNIKKDEKAKQYFYASYKKYDRDSKKDRSLFWTYKVSNDTKFLKKILDSSNINIYSLYAHERFNSEPKNYFVSLQTNDEFSKKNLQDPFVWQKIYKEIKETPQDKLVRLSQDYQHKNMSVVNRFIVEKASNYSTHGYLMPYNEYLSELSKDEKALVYAIMKQESAFIPSALSRSFALGLMQLMPFLVDALAKGSKEEVQYKEMFNPKKNIEYALKHLAWMKKFIKHPLYIAYGYNGGTGFLRKHLKTGAFQAGKYEPFLSMEMMRNSETREYGKKVLANYVMYKKILGEKVSIVKTFETIIPSNYVRYSQL